MGAEWGASIAASYRNSERLNDNFSVACVNRPGN